MTEVTRILQAIEQGDPQAAEQLLPQVYDELRRLAAMLMAREKPDQTLDATALVHEAYVRLVDSSNEQALANRRHFFAAAAEAMRRILVENARRKKRVKHGGDLHRQELQADAVAAPTDDNQLLALDAALQKLAAQHPEKARLVELRYFGGLTGDESAHLLGISPSTADRYWVFARAWLRREINSDGALSACPAPKI